ncbi:putative odorant-binding protein A10 [Drosophila sulfurigaster albostrigata]|uniref:putative odorant-binding protein A10 n=1 Tax=Drosophila sulfurigaster albostrigata TaxID=89887 RepID=UPI002D21E4DA|nr:putative odorant-binding protein A10 [Drosophila sulfurigaster albostrigata]
MFPLTIALVLLNLLLLAAVNGHPPAATTPAPAPMSAALMDATGEAYDSKFDNVDLDEILNQERLLNNYIKCLENAGPCTADAKMLKDILPDAMMTDCVKCTEKQKYGADKVTKHLIDNRLEDWMRLEKIYDPQGSYRIKYEASKLSNKPANEKIELEAGDGVQGDS